MIKNEREYRITRAQVQELERALERVVQRDPAAGGIHPLLRKAEEEALHSQIADLRAQMAEYEVLRSGERTVLEVHSFEEFPRALIRARISAGLTQRELAERLGLKEQQIQRYEATEYASASMERVGAVIRALGLKVREQVVLPGAESQAAA